jgi:hypothetical protein
MVVRARGPARLRGWSGLAKRPGDTATTPPRRKPSGSGLGRPWRRSSAAREFCHPKSRVLPQGALEGSLRPIRQKHAHSRDYCGCYRSAPGSAVKRPRLSQEWPRRVSQRWQVNQVSCSPEPPFFGPAHRSSVLAAQVDLQIIDCGAFSAEARQILAWPPLFSGGPDYSRGAATIPEEVLPQPSDTPRQRIRTYHGCQWHRCHQ